MSQPRKFSFSKAVAASAAGTLGLLLLAPLMALLWQLSWQDMYTTFSSGPFRAALGLSLVTSVISVSLCALLGTPLAWWLACTQSRLGRLVGALIDLPVMIPPAVVGLGLLYAWGPQGMLGRLLDTIGIRLPFHPAAVVMAQVVVAAPFYLKGASQAFRRTGKELFLVAQSLGASPARSFFEVVMGASKEGLVGAASLAWARALGEFGATLLFAGNLQGRTQTLPLAIMSAIQVRLQQSASFALALALLGSVALVGLRWGSSRTSVSADAGQAG